MFMTYVCALIFNYQIKKCENLGFNIPPINQSENILLINQDEKKYLNAEKIKLLVWNIYKSEKKNWSEDFIKFSRDNDVLLIQEAHLNTTFINTILKIKNYNFVHATSFIFEQDKLATGTLIGSPFVMEKTSMLRTDKTEPIIHTPKTISIAEFSIESSQENLLVLNIHGLNATKTRSFKEQILSTTKLIKNHQGPIIFAGDFNTRNKSRTRFLRSFMKFHEFSEVSWPKDDRMKFMGHPLDHVFVKKLSILKSQVRSDIKSSDHKALEVELSLKENPQF